MEATETPLAHGKVVSTVQGAAGNGSHGPVHDFSYASGYQVAFKWGLPISQQTQVHSFLVKYTVSAFKRTRDSFFSL